VINAHELQGRPLITAAGLRLGRLHDLRCAWTGTAVSVTHLVYGRRGLLEKLGFRGERYDTIAWSHVKEIRADVIVVGDEVQVKVPAARRD
jgi:sporulation protein YlmC with PRC-barrel domain